MLAAVVVRSAVVDLIGFAGLDVVGFTGLLNVFEVRNKLSE